LRNHIHFVKFIDLGNAQGVNKIRGIWESFFHREPELHFGSGCSQKFRLLGDQAPKDCLLFSPLFLLYTGFKNDDKSTLRKNRGGVMMKHVLISYQNRQLINPITLLKKTADGGTTKAKAISEKRRHLRQRRKLMRPKPSGSMEIRGYNRWPEGHLASHLSVVVLSLWLE
jgi:hypothetical protein